jgi:iron complex transport system ATP-binding protein
MNKLNVLKKKTPPLLEFKDVSLIRGDNIKVLNRVCLTVQSTENVAILGPNGAGKSSLIKLITREFYPFPDKNGFVFKVWGKEVWDVFDLRSSLGIVSGDLQEICARGISGMEVVLSGFFSSIGLYFHHPSPRMKKKAEEVMDFLEIGHLKNRIMTEMSTGEARRFLIARALVHDPKMMILDEPAASLDLHALHKFRNILRKIVRAGTHIILITHHLPDIIPEINRVILLKGGKVGGEGPKEKILTSSRISRFFDVTVNVRKSGGYFYAYGS